MRLRVCAVVLGVITGFMFSWARMTDPRTFHAMLSLDSPRMYLLMGAAVATKPGVKFLPRLQKAIDLRLGRR